MQFSLFLLGLAILIGLSSAQSNRRIDARTCNCKLVYKPYCATNEQTYGNLCQLECAGARVKFEGVCAVKYVPEEQQQRGNSNGQYQSPPLVPQKPTVNRYPAPYVPPPVQRPVQRPAPYVPRPTTYERPESKPAPPVQRPAPKPAPYVPRPPQTFVPPTPQRGSYGQPSNQPSWAPSFYGQDSNEE